MKNFINLLPHSYRRQIMLRKRVVQWSWVIGIMLAAGLAAHWYERQESVTLQQELELLAREAEPTQTTVHQLADMRKRLDELQSQESVASELESQRNALVLLGVVSSAAQETGGRLRINNFDVKDFQQMRLPGDQAPPASVPATLVLSGVSLDHEAVGKLFAGLKDSGVFSRVDLNSSKERENGSGLRDYEIRCEF